jgi:putative sigma-54 modulation protein
MKLTVTGRHFVVTDATRRLVAEKLERLDRVLNDRAVSAQVTVGKERQQVVCELVVHVRGDHTLHAVGRHAQISPAVTASVDKVQQQAVRLADRWKTRRRDAGRKAAGAAGAIDVKVPLAPNPAPRVVRSRGTALKPMSLDDAILALSSGPRPFLVFRQASSETVAILYRRPDGNYGLVEPEA